MDFLPVHLPYRYLAHNIRKDSQSLLISKKHDIIHTEGEKYFLILVMKLKGGIL